MNSIGNVVNAKSDISEMLNKIREVSSKNKAFGMSSTQDLTSSGSEKLSFDSAMSSVKGVFDQVNSLQSQSESTKNSFLLGDKNVSISDVIVSSQKSKLAFEGLITVRNKILEAYKEIMSMPV
jgi:flagellar hook-basal body complex protein FliE